MGIAKRGVCVALGLVLSGAMSSTVVEAQQPWDEDAWDVGAAESRVVEYQGRPALYMAGGTAWLRDSDFQDGVIEFDLAVSGELGFHGLRFRAVDRANHEHVYIRPHLSDRADAVQYNPVYNGTSSWQLYADARYVLPLSIPGERWMHVRVGVEGGRMEMAVDGQLLVFPDLVRDVTSGAIGIAASASGAWFANFTVKPGADPRFSDESGGDVVPAPEATVTEWRVSDAFPESEVDGVLDLSESQKSARTWDVVPVHTRGVANIATLRPRIDDSNTVFAAITLRSSEAQTVPVRFGFSDRVRVFLNGRQVYAGADEFGSRDYRFLGTVGLFDQLFLPLEAGDNEVWLAVSETFGGWGMTLQLPEGQGVEVR